MIVLKLKFVLIAGGLSVLAFFALLMFVTIFISEEAGNSNAPSERADMSAAEVSEAVLAHRPMVEQYADEYDIPEYVPILLALIEVESGGEVRLETGHSKLRQKKIQWYHIKFTEGVHDYG